MQRPSDRRPQWRAGRLLAFFLAVGAGLGGLVLGWNRLQARKPAKERFSVTDVRRADLLPTLRAGGRIESGRRTVIECHLENLSAGVQGQRLSAGGASVLLKLIPEGTTVKQGDVLAVLDSSDYIELLRLQKINVERAQADKLQAELDHEIARLAIVEYRDGTLKELLEDYHRRVALARGDLERARDRLNWTHAMKAKGYVSASTVASDEYTAAQFELTLQREEGELDVFRRFTAPRTLRELEGEILGARANLDYLALRAQRHLQRLETLQTQVDLCTIRAPHDGYVIHANDARRSILIEEGMPVRQNQTLFYLPDLNDMEVVALLNESIVEEVKVGMMASVQVEGIPNRFMRGRVTKVAQLAVPDWRSDVRYFEGTVKLEKPLPGLKPGMSAQVEVEMPRREDVLAVPSEAITMDDGQDVCFVIRGEDLERRPVKLGRVTLDMTEITHGLREGEQVVLKPRPEDLEDEEPSEPAPIASSDAPAAGASSPSDVAALQ
jgi:HlyD family secretion protein